KDNGIKCFADGVEFDQQAEESVERLVEERPKPINWREWGDLRDLDIIGEYRNEIVDFSQDFGEAPQNMEIVVDCGNGMAAMATPQVLRELGAGVVTLNGNIDGTFSGRSSKPTQEALTKTSAFVKDGDTDLGIAHDGDADRLVVLDGDGEIVHEDTILAILAREYVSRSAVDDPVVVTTPNASARVDEQVQNQGGRVVRCPLGELHEGIASTSGTVVFAGEPWKHIHPRFGGWIDGIVSAALIARLVAESGLSTLRSGIAEHPYRKVSIDCPEDQKDAVMDQLVERLPQAFPEGQLSTEHGVRVDLPSGSWFLVRQSGTEPKIRLYVESESVDELIDEISTIVKRTIDQRA
ncbi:MAG: phosphomannomutase, partial [Halobacteriaceae archaeon]